jgi:hypothetical protein
MLVCTTFRIVQFWHWKPVSTPDGAPSQVPSHCVLDTPDDTAVEA